MHASPAEQSVYRWQVPGRRVVVDLPHNCVDRIAAETLDGFRGEGRGIEVGGLLLGRVRRDGALNVVEVEDVEPIECEHVAGPSLMLSASDRRALEMRLKQRKGAVVGFYRSNTRREFAATMEDDALMSWYFANASSVFLLVHAGRGDEPLRGAFLTWEGRSLAPRTPADEFPFSPAALPARQSRAAEKQAAGPTGEARGSGRWIAAAVILVGLIAGSAVERMGSKIASGNGEGSRSPSPLPHAAATIRDAPAPRTIASPPPDPVLSPPPTAPEPAPVITPQPPAEPATPTDRTPAAAGTSQSADRRIVAFVPPPLGRIERPAPVDLPTVTPPVPQAVPFAPAATEAPPPAPPPAPPVRPVTPSAASTPVSVAVDAAARTRSAKFVPPTAVHQERPDVPPELRRTLTRDILINVRVYVDRNGKVEYAELLSDGTGENRELASRAVFASRRWQFAPASRDGKPVPAQAVLRFRFAP